MRAALIRLFVPLFVDGFSTQQPSANFDNE